MESAVVDGPNEPPENVAICRRCGRPRNKASKMGENKSVSSQKAVCETREDERYCITTDVRTAR